MQYKVRAIGEIFHRRKFSHNIIRYCQCAAQCPLHTNYYLHNSVRSQARPKYALHNTSGSVIRVFQCFHVFVDLLRVEDDRTSVSDLFKELKTREVITSEVFRDVG